MRLQLEAQSVFRLISRLEDARATGTLGSIVGQAEDSGSTGEICDLYREFAQRKSFLRSRHRAEHVRSIVLEAMWPLRKPQIIFHGALAKFQRVDRNTGELHGWTIAHIDCGDVVLRPDQALSASYWGIGFDLDSTENNEILERHLLGSALTRLVKMLRALERVEYRFRRARYENVHILPARGSADFEQLMIDVLNEDQYRARHAPLEEDLLEKTDIRVHVQGVDRKRGARVQVTMMTDPLLYQNKLAMMSRLEEMVVLSPASIARFLTETNKDLGLANSGMALLKEQATEIRDIIFSALKRRYESPLGPLLSLPENLRTTIREFVDLEAAKSTSTLRIRELKTGRTPRKF